jgi:hypothetical protein
MSRQSGPDCPGPTIQETVFARKIAMFLAADPELTAWIKQKIETPEGQGELKLLVCAARRAKGKA